MLTKFLKLTTALTLLLSMALSATPVLAAGASITLDASKSTVANGSTVVVTIYMNGGGTAVDSIEADLNYTSSKLQYVGFSATGTAFEISAQHDSGSAGFASVARGTTSPVSGFGLVGAVTFRAIASSGAASVSVAGSSALVSAGNAVAYTPGSVSINLGAEVAASSHATAAVPAAPKDTTPPKITAIKAANVTSFSTTLTWTTDEGSDSVVEYGLDTSYGLSASVPTPTTTHSVALSSAFLTPLTLLHYHVKSTDAAGNVAVSDDQNLLLPGIAVTIIVRSPDGTPQPGAMVTLGNQTGTTNAQGKVTLDSPLGNQKITTVYQGVTVQKSINVAKSSKPLPPYQLDLSRQPLNRWMLASTGLVITVLILLGIDAVVFGSHFFRRLSGLHFHHSLQKAPAPATPKPDVAAPVPAEPASTVEQKVNEIMGEPVPPAVSAPSTPSAPPISHFSELTPTEPLVIKLQPLDDASQSVAGPETPSTPPALAAVPIADVSHAVTDGAAAANVAVRLKKPAHHHSHKPKAKKIIPTAE